MAQTVEQALKQAVLFSDEDVYRLIQLPASAITLASSIIAEVSEPFNMLIVDKDEVSLILQAEAFEDFLPRLRDYVLSPVLYQLITFDVVLEPDLVGFLAQISSVLAKANIPILAFSAYSRDHLFVSQSHFQAAITILKNLQVDL